MRAILEALPAAVYTTDADGRIEYHNEAAVTLAGHAPQPGGDRWWISDRLYRPDGSPLPIDDCPMAIALREGRAIQGEEALIERPDGARVPFLAYPTPLRDGEGRVVGGINMLIDITERKAAEEELQRRQDDLEDFFENGTVGLHWVGSDGRILRVNDAELELLGYAREEYVGRPISDYHADQAAIEDILARLSRGERLDKYPARLKARDGTIRHVLISSNVQFKDGQFLKTRCFTLDVTDLRAAEERRKLLIDELNHRVKNTLATVQSIAAQTLRSTPSPEVFSRAFTDRLVALSRAHDLLNLESWQGASLREVIAAALFLHDPSRAHLRGEAVRVSPRAALALSMVVHELASNAAKYGALSVPDGRLDVVWRLVDGTSALDLSWKEQGGPGVVEPARRGFGSRLIERSLTHELGGTAKLFFEQDGLRCSLNIRLDQGSA
ncbi:hypothetical protein [Azospirillum doebereinerae]